MGHSVSADRDGIDLQKFFSLGQAKPKRDSASPHPGRCSRHHVKAWKFEKRGHCVADSPLVLCDEQGLFCAELQRTCSYLILHVQMTKTMRDEGDATKGSGLPCSDSAEHTLEELATWASASCTPRGLNIEVVAQSEAVTVDTLAAEGAGGACAVDSPALKLSYSIFVWHGVGVDPRVKARAFTQAFELERLMRLGLPRRRAFVETLERAVRLRGLEGSCASRRRQDENDRGVNSIQQGLPADAGASRPCSARRTNGNRLLAAILDVPWASDAGGCGGSAGSTSGVGAAALGGGAGGSGTVGQRFPRLGLSVCRSLGVAPSESQADPKRQQCWVGPRAAGPIDDAPAGVAHLAARGAAGTTPRAAQPQEAEQAASGASMEVDDGPDGATTEQGRKRLRGPDAARPVRGGPSTKCGASTANEKAALRSKGAVPAAGMPALNLAAVNGRTHPVANRSDTPAMLNLEEINMTEEELIRSYDPENEENNYHLPHHLYKQLQLKQYRNECSEIVDKQVYLSSYQVASNLECLRRHQITHIVNTAADVCDNCFPDQFHYLTYYLKDANNEEISRVFYRTFEWIQNAIARNGRVLVHCREGVSRSATMVLAYLMWRFGIAFETAHDRVRKVRPICSPNTGFTCQLLLLGKKLGLSGAPAQVLSAVDRPAIFRVAPHHPKEPFLLLVPSEVSTATAWPLFDPRFGWVVQRGHQLVLWIGAQVPDKEATRAAVVQHGRWLETFERCRCVVSVCNEGSETTEFWQALDMQDPPVDDECQMLSAPRQCYDADFEIMSAEVPRSNAGCNAGAVAHAVPARAADIDRPPLTARQGDRQGHDMAMLPTVIVA